MKTAELTGALLDYWCARAEGIPAADLEIRQVPRTDNRICVRTMRGKEGVLGVALEVLAYSTNWAQGGPLLERSITTAARLPAGGWHVDTLVTWHGKGRGDTVLQAVCRAVVHQAYGDNVEDRPCL